MFQPLSAALIAVPLVAVAADKVPTFDLDPTCSGAVPSPMTGGRGTDACKRSELSARDQLVREWSTFQEAERTRCVQLTNMTRMPSYVQVLTCLEAARDTRGTTSPKGGTTSPKERSTVGSGR